MIAFTERRRWRPPYQTGKSEHVHAKHYKHNEDRRMAPGVCGNGSVLLSHSENVVTRIGTHTHTELLLNQWTDFEIISQECSLGNPLPKLLKQFRSVEQNGHQSKKFKKTFKGLLLSNQLMDFEIIIQECLLGEPGIKIN